MGPDAGSLLEWYDRNARALPWRVPPADSRQGVLPDPYLVWLSEVMLQQTTVVAVAPYFRDFIGRWPSVDALAAADLDDVLTAWAGLGYYARARNLHRCARVVAHELGGAFPKTEAELGKLPGVGPYTAAAIAAIAFDEPATAVDGNIERVMARLHAVADPLPAAKSQLRKLAVDMTPAVRVGDYTQALMDLGATICTPKSPRCMLCPLVDACAAKAQGIAETLPRRLPKKYRPTRRGVAYWGVRSDGAVLLRRRPEKGLLGGMMEVPSSAWRKDADLDALERTLAGAPTSATWHALPGLVRHGFTHFELELRVLRAVFETAPKVDGRWVMPDAFDQVALPSLMQKVVRHALAHV